ncbi:aconitate hydratase 1 [Galbibacter marinus]|uniref:Aconitate hydratase 1 n=1 Tax=Galbibacter marinus TaxID=555500 RepID=K2QIU9_9FLAO|nr:aconitate hydratase 1 [Galbibacter marinus]
MSYKIASLRKLEERGIDVARLPFSIRILLENVLRNRDGFAITEEHLDTLTHWDASGTGPWM